VGGFAGFDDAPMAQAQFVTVHGGHGAGLEDRRLPGVSTYILKGELPARSPGSVTRDLAQP
jgi:hypothetical protein